MKISYNWLKKYLDINLPAQEVAQLLTQTGLEVESVEKIQQIEGGLEGLLVGEVLSAIPHPNADKLRLTTVDIGINAPLAIVCGAPNVAQGQKVIVATVGATLYPIDGQPFTIKKSKIRGEESEGMICAEDEIGIGNSHEGIMVLPPNTLVGTSAAEFFGLQDDFRLEVGLTPNRSDATCHLGVAQDLYATLVTNHHFEGKISPPSVENFAIDHHKHKVNITVEDTQLCPRYAGVCISNVTVKESPQWLKDCLIAVGLKPKNNIVDITNFILHELGQPLHAFDLSAIEKQQIVVKTLPENTPFTTLDEIKRQLQATDLMICDAEKPLCIAGVFGGQNSGVKESTTDIFLESACFDAVSVRKTGKHHKLRTDAAMRFEKGADPNLCVYALKRAALLIKELAGGQIASEITDIYPKPVEKTQITVRYAQINRVIGVKIAHEKVAQILQSMDMQTITQTPENITVSVPTNKVDVLREIDLIEEIVRIYGFNNIPTPSTVNSSLANSPDIDNIQLQNKIADYLSGNGFFEMMANSISNSKHYPNDAAVLSLINSLSSDLDVLRKNLLFSGLDAIALNLRKNNADLKLFEFGKTYQKTEKGIDEKFELSLFLVGKKTAETWQNPTKNLTFFDLKNTMVNILRRLGIENGLIAEPFNNEEIGYGLQIGLPRNTPILKMGQVSKTIQKQFGIKSNDIEIYYGCLDWEAALKRVAKKKITFTPLSVYPTSRRDLALLIDKKVSFAEIEDIALKNGKKILKSVNLFDIFEDANKIGADKKSYAISFVFEDASQTLTDNMVDNVMNKLIELYQKNLGATLR